MPAAGTLHQGKRPQGDGNGTGSGKPWKTKRASRPAGKASAAVLAAIAMGILAAAPPEPIGAAAITDDDALYMEIPPGTDDRDGFFPASGPAGSKLASVETGTPVVDFGPPPPGGGIQKAIGNAAGGVRDESPADPAGRGNRAGETGPFFARGAGPDSPLFADILRLIRSGTPEARAVPPGGYARTVAPIPDDAREPAGLILLGSALMVLAWLGRRRRP